MKEKLSQLARGIQIYKMHFDDGIYSLCSPRFWRMPFKLTIRLLNGEDRMGRKIHMVRGLEKDKRGNYVFEMAVVETGIRNWFVGSKFEHKKDERFADLVAFNFSLDKEYMAAIFLLRGSRTTEEEKFSYCNDVIPKLEVLAIARIEEHRNAMIEMEERIQRERGEEDRQAWRRWINSKL